jgi:cellulose/xylan binding protein with CBM9 domain
MRRQAVLGLCGSIFQGSMFQGSLWCGAICLALLGPSCVSGQASEEPPEEIKKLILDQAPEKLTPVNVNFEDKITLLGVEVEPGLDVAPGKRVKLTMYWRADKPITDSGWKLFTHVLDGSGDRLLNVDNVGPLRHLGANGQAWPPSSWKPGKIYVDSQTFTLPKKVKSSQVQVVAGIWRGRDRLELRSGPSAGDDRALVATLNVVTNSAAKEPGVGVPQLEVPELAPASVIKIDGKLDEAAWRDAADTSAFVNVRTGKPAPESPVQGSAKLAWDAKWLYVGFDVKDQTLTGGFDPKQKDPQLWTKDCVEIMIDPDGDGDNKNYYEIQINPQNLVFDSQFDDYNRPRQEPNGPFGHQEWSAKLESVVRLRGTLDNDKDKDEGYVVEARIPWASLDKAAELPPKPGSNWRLNLYAMQDNQGVAWSPILEQGNFHKAARFGRISWVGPRGAAPASGGVVKTEQPSPTPARAPAPATPAAPVRAQSGAGAGGNTRNAAAQDQGGLSVKREALAPAAPHAAPAAAPGVPRAPVKAPEVTQ